MTVMQNEVQRALDELQALGSAAELHDLAARGGLPVRRKVNAHVHLPPNFSAFGSIEQVLDLAAQQGIAVLGASNYYDYDVYADFARLAKSKGIFPLFGLEIICWLDDLAKAGVKINDPGNPGKFYLCGKGITKFAAMSAEAQRLLGIIRRNDSTRMARIVEKLADTFDGGGVNTGLTESAVIDRVMKYHGCPRNRVYLQERHVCQAFQERFFEIVPSEQRIAVLTRIFSAAPKAGPEDAVKIQNEIRAHLLKAGKPAYVEETFVNFDDARQLIVELGGVPCYPTLADGTSPICPFETPVDALIAQIKRRGVGCAEFIPIRNEPAVLSSYVKAMRLAGLVVTAGTEHNTLDLLPIEPTCVNGQPIPDDIQDIFWEGACVVAAHQFLTLHGEPGFEIGCGQDRIASLAGLGETVIQRYRESVGMTNRGDTETRRKTQ
jgi:hypothetical protein